MVLTDWIQKMKDKWGVKSNWDVFMILIVFSIAGMFIVFERRPLFHVLGITAATPFWVKFIAWLIIVFPAYQLNLIVFGFLLGQFSFFWKKEKQLGRFLLRPFTGKHNPA